MSLRHTKANNQKITEKTEVENRVRLGEIEDTLLDRGFFDNEDHLLVIFMCSFLDLLYKLRRRSKITSDYTLLEIVTLSTAPVCLCRLKRHFPCLDVLNRAGCRCTPSTALNAEHCYQKYSVRLSSKHTIFVPYFRNQSTGESFGIAL